MLKCVEKISAAVLLLVVIIFDSSVKRMLKCVEKTVGTSLYILHCDSGENHHSVTVHCDSEGIVILCHCTL